MTITIHALVRTTHVFIKGRNLKERIGRQIYQLATKYYNGTYKSKFHFSKYLIKKTQRRWVTKQLKELK